MQPDANFTSEVTNTKAKRPLWIPPTAKEYAKHSYV